MRSAVTHKALLTATWLLVASLYILLTFTDLSKLNLHKEVIFYLNNSHVVNSFFYFKFLVWCHLGILLFNESIFSIRQLIVQTLVATITLCLLFYALFKPAVIVQFASVIYSIIFLMKFRSKNETFSRQIINGIVLCLSALLCIPVLYQFIFTKSFLVRIKSGPNYAVAFEYGPIIPTFGSQGSSVEVYIVSPKGIQKFFDVTSTGFCNYFTTESLRKHLLEEGNEYRSEDDTSIENRLRNGQQEDQIPDCNMA